MKRTFKFTRRNNNDPHSNCFRWKLTRKLLIVILGSTAVVFVLVWTSPKQTYRSDIHPRTMPNAIYESNSMQWPIEKDIFNCTLSRKCRFFDPHNFFQTRDYQQFLVNREINRNLPSLSSFAWSGQDDNKNNAFERFPSSFTFVHVHKCGGTTVKELFQDLKSAMTRTGRQVKVTHYRHSIGGGSERQKQRNSQLRQEHIDSIIQQQSAPTAVPVFAVVRDPIERFVSGVQQVMHYNTNFRRSCLKSGVNARRETLMCAIQEVKDNFFLNDIHLLPMAAHFQLLNHVQISIFYMPSKRQNDSDDLSSQSFVSLLRYFDSTKLKHTHDRTQVQYATSKVLAEMTVEKDCDDDMIRALCELYHVDVLFLKALGYPTPYC